MLFRSCFLFLLLTSLFMACNSEESGSQPKDQLQDVLPEDVLQLLQNRIKAADVAADSADLVSAHRHLKEVAQIYVDYQQWDSLYLINRKLYLQSYRSKTYEAGISLIQHFSPQVPQSQDTIKAKLSELIGFLAYCQGELALSKKAYNECAEIWERHYISRSLMNSYNMLGNLYIISGEYPKAIQIFQSSIIAAKARQDSSLLEANYDNLGKAFVAEKKWKEAVKAYEEGKKSGIAEEGKYEYRLAEAYLEGMQLNEAESFAKQALKIMTKNKGSTSLSFSTLYQTLAEIYSLRKNYQEAMRYSRQAVKSAIAEYPEGHREIGKSYVYLGEAYSNQGNIQLALEHLQMALKIFIPGFRPSNIYEAPDPELLSQESWLMVSLKIKGKIFEDRYRKNKVPEDLQRAATHYQLGIHYINQIKQYYSHQESKLYWGTYSIPYIENAIRVQLQLHQLDQEPARLDTAFLLAQSANAFLLREQLQEREALERGGVPADTIALFGQQKQEIRNLREALPTAVSNIQKDSITQGLFQQSRRFEKLNDQLLKSYPAYQRIKYEIPQMEIEAVRRQLKPNELLVKYFMGEKQLYIFAINNNQQRVYQTAINEQFIQDIQDYRKCISDLDYIRENQDLAEAKFLKSAHALYQKLMAPILNELNSNGEHQTLVIIPDGWIGYLAFDCLLQRKAASWLDSKAFLIHDYAIRYHYAAGLIGHQSSPTPVAKGFLGFGIEYDQSTLDELQLISQDSIANKAIQDVLRGKKLSKLRYADDEVLAIAQDLKGQTFINEAATKENFLTHCSSYKLIHIAAHSFIHEEADHHSAYLVFNPDAKKQDYLLSLSEVYGLRLNADLIVLSACQTGTGELVGGEGVMSLARAFQIAGSNSILASQWSISDQTSSVIMQEFYAHLKKGLSKSEALRQAKLKYLSSDQLSSPAFRIPGYWAAGILVGDDQILNLAVENTAIPWWLIGGGLIVLLLIWRGRKS